MKKFYKISISGDSEGSCIRELTDEQYELIKGILDECESEYVGQYIEEVQRKYVVWVWEKIDDIYVKHDDAVMMIGFQFVGEQKADMYHSCEKQKTYYHFFDSEKEAIAFADKEAKRLGCKISAVM